MRARLATLCQYQAERFPDKLISPLSQPFPSPSAFISRTTYVCLPHNNLLNIARTHFWNTLNNDNKVENFIGLNFETRNSLLTFFSHELLSRGLLFCSLGRVFARCDLYSFKIDHNILSPYERCLFGTLPARPLQEYQRNRYLFRKIQTQIHIKCRLLYTQNYLFIFVFRI